MSSNFMPCACSKAGGEEQTHDAVKSIAASIQKLRYAKNVFVDDESALVKKSARTVLDILSSIEENIASLKLEVEDRIDGSWFEEEV